MKNFLFLIFIGISLTLKGQENSANEFYSYFNSVLINKKSYPINLNILEYGCLGNQIKWNVKLSINEEKIEVRFFVQKPTQISNFNKTESHLDTTFVIPIKEMIKKIEHEKVNLLSIRPLVESKYKISVKNGVVEKEFLTKRAEGLFFILRYNKSWEEYLKKK